MERKMPDRILVTGGCGFIGSNFIHHILHYYSGVSSDRDHSYYASNSKITDLKLKNIDKLTYAANQNNLKSVQDYPGYSFEKCDISDSEKIEKIFEEFRPECVIHFAAESHVDRSIESGHDFIISNVLGTHVLLEASRRAGVELFVHVSTDEVYGSTQKDSFSEESNLNPSSPYSSSKASSDLVAISHYKTYNFPVIITRCTNNFGPRQHPEKLIPKVIQLASQNNQIPIYGSGMQVRDWLYVKDHCQAILDLVRLGEIGEIYNIAGRNEINNLQIVNTILNKLGSDPDLIEHVEDRKGHDFRYSVDDSKIRKLGWAPQMPFEDGLGFTVNESTSHHPNEKI